MATKDFSYASIAKILKEKRISRQLSVREVSLRLQKYHMLAAEKTIYGWESGKRSPDLATFLALCQIYDIQELCELTGGQDDGALLSAEEFSRLKKYRVLDTHGREVADAVLEKEYERMTRHDDALIAHTDNITYINCYDLAVSAGTGQPLGDTYYKTRLEIPTERVPDDAHYCLRVTGDSMEPAYRDGDIVFVRRQDEFVHEGEIGIFFLNGEGYIKRLGRKELISLNPKYPPISLGEYDSVLCQGKVLGKI